MSRICGVTKIAPREGDEMRCVRVREEDAVALQDALNLDAPIEPGMYQVIPEVPAAYRPIVAVRLGIEESEVSNGMMT